MALIPVEVTYFTGIANPNLFNAATLWGSWDAAGRFNKLWTATEMSPLKRSPDGRPAFSATIQLDDSQVDWQFHWGVTLAGAGRCAEWGIMEEANDVGSRDRTCTFTLAKQTADGSRQRVDYYLSHSHRLGAQKYFGAGKKPGIRFAVWAPNARDVSVVVGNLWSDDDPSRSSSIKPDSIPANQSLPRGTTGGGYVADDGTGSVQGWGPFSMPVDEGGVRMTRTNDGELQDFERFDHLPYMFRVVKDDGQVAYRTDLYSRCQIGFGAHRPDGPYRGRTAHLDGSVSCSVIVDADKVAAEFDEPRWPETTWIPDEGFWSDPRHAPSPAVPKRLEDLVIYELHLGALGFGRAASEPGTLVDALALLDHLELLGVNAVELLPLSEFGGGAGGWGYATSHYFAIEYGGGGRDQYKWFIRECHNRGIAVILDIVFNHYSHNAERAEWMYDSNAHERNIYYWYEGRPEEYGEPTGGYLDNVSTAWAPRYYEPMVRRMITSAALAQAVEFHVDGFRVDQTTSIHAYNVLHANGHRVSSANVFGQKLLREFNRALRFLKPEIMLIAEDHSNWEGVTTSTDDGGLGFGASWYADFYHHLIGDTDKGNDYAKLIKTAGFGDDRPLAMDYLAGALAASGGRKVVYHESHDEAGNGKFTKRTINVAVNGAPLVGATRDFAEARCRFAAGVSLLSAGTPMFLFGEEVGAEKDFLYNHVLDNREDLLGLRAGSGRSLFEYYRKLIALRRREPSLKSRNIEVLFAHNEHRLLAFRRWKDDTQFLIIGSLNNHPYDSPNYVLRSPVIRPTAWKEVFNSDAAAFRGRNIGNSGATLQSGDGEFACVIPANAVIVFQNQS